MLVYATSKGRLQGIDLRTMQIGWTFVSPPSHGNITYYIALLVCLSTIY
jgi:hypothetical protein